jgi:NAD(P)-dependent dehydrogenase (short-subunit alcohol dehydrogenase family)
MRTMRDVQGKVAVVTGAASGIGRGMVESFVAAGMKVVLADVDPQVLERTTGALRQAGADVSSVVTDVSKPAEVELLARRALSAYGAVHVVCNNAGINNIGATPTWASTLDDWNWIVGVNLMGVLHGMRTFLPILIEQGDEGHIVNTASIAGLAAGNALYSMTKFGIVGLTESMQAELQQGGHKPRLSLLCPGLVNTDILNSERHRPEGVQASVAASGPAIDAAKAALAAAVEQAMSPRSVGDQVLAAIREQRFYIFTHPDRLRFVEQRMRTILAAAGESGKIEGA